MPYSGWLPRKARMIRIKIPGWGIVSYMWLVVSNPDLDSGDCLHVGKTFCNGYACRILSRSASCSLSKFFKFRLANLDQAICEHWLVTQGVMHLFWSSDNLHGVGGRQVCAELLGRRQCKQNHEALPSTFPSWSRQIWGSRNNNCFKWESSFVRRNCLLGMSSQVKNGSLRSLGGLCRSHKGKPCWCRPENCSPSQENGQLLLNETKKTASKEGLILLLKENTNAWSWYEPFQSGKIFRFAANLANHF